MNNRKGFTLVEVMVASIIFSIVMLNGLAFFSFGKRPVIRAQETSFALQLAEDDLEAAKMYGYGAHDQTTGPRYAPGNGDIAYTVTRKTSYLGDPFRNHAEQVTCAVTWNSASSGASAAKSISEMKKNLFWLMKFDIVTSVKCYKVFLEKNM